MRALGVAIVTLWGLAGCGKDPILEKAEADAAAKAAARSAGPEVEPGAPHGTPGTPGTPGTAGSAGVPGAAQPGDPSGGPVGQVGPDGQPIPGVAEAPAPGDPSVPPPGGTRGDPSVPPPGGSIGVPNQPTAPGQGGGVPGQPGAPTGPTVAVSGEVVYADWKKGRVRISAFDGDHGVPTGKRPSIIGFGEIDRPGAFTLNVAENAGKIYIEAAVDEDGDGKPGPTEPQGKADRFPVTVGAKAVSGVEIALKRREPPPGGRGEDF